MNSLTAEQVTNTTQFREFLRQGLAEMDRLFALLAEDQKEIDRLAASLTATLSETQAIREQNELAFAAQQIYYETQRLQDEIRHLREDNERRDKDNERRDRDAARERENLILRLENQLLRAERGLPPPSVGEAKE